MKDGSGQIKEKTGCRKRGRGGTARKDHLGNRYPSLRAMADAYGIAPGTLSARLRRGVPVEEALTEERCEPAPNAHAVECAGPDGKMYRSFAAMCRANGISYHACMKRRGRGFTDEEAAKCLAERKRRCTDADGIVYPSVSAMCRAHGVSQQTFSYRRKKGVPLRQALVPAGGNGKT